MVTVEQASVDEAASYYSSRELFSDSSESLYPLDTLPSQYHPNGLGIFSTYENTPSQIIDPSFTTHDPELVMQSMLLRGAAGEKFVNTNDGQRQKIAEVRSSEAYLITTNGNGDINIFFRQFLTNQDHGSTSLRSDHAGGSHAVGLSGKTETIAALQVSWDAQSGTISSDYKRGYNLVRTLQEYESIANRRGQLAKIHSRRLISSDQLTFVENFNHTELHEGEEKLLTAAGD